MNICPRSLEDFQTSLFQQQQKNGDKLKKHSANHFLFINVLPQSMSYRMVLKCNSIQVADIRLHVCYIHYLREQTVHVTVFYKKKKNECNELEIVQIFCVFTQSYLSFVFDNKNALGVTLKLNNRNLVL